MELDSFVHDRRFDKPKENFVNKPKLSYWDILYAWLLSRDTPYSFRPVAHPQKNPFGVHPYTVHKFHGVPGQDPIEVLCTESLEGVRKDAGTGKMIKKDCFWCDLYEVAQTFQGGEFLNWLEIHMPDHYTVMEAINPFNCRVYIMPSLIRARIQTVGQGKERKTDVFPDMNTITSICLWVKTQDGLLKASPGGFMGNLAAFNAPYKQAGWKIDDPEQGSWFTVQDVSQQGYQFGNLENPTNLYQTVPNFEALMKHYPDIRKYGQTSTKMKKSKVQTYNFSKRLFFENEYGKELQEKFGYYQLPDGSWGMAFHPDNFSENVDGPINVFTGANIPPQPSWAGNPTPQNPQATFNNNQPSSFQQSPSMGNLQQNQMQFQANQYQQPGQGFTNYPQPNPQPSFNPQGTPGMGFTPQFNPQPQQQQYPGFNQNNPGYPGQYQPPF